MKFPVLVYKTPGRFRFRNGKTYRYASMTCQEELDSYLGDGWHLSKEDAILGKKVEAPIIEPVDDNAPPTREEMQAKATELGLKFDGRTSDRKLLKMIADALGE